MATTNTRCFVAGLPKTLPLQLRPNKRRHSLRTVSATLASDSYVLPSGMIDYYEVLGIDDTATEKEIRAAWRDLCKVCHPDISGDDVGHNLCIILNEAYEVLSDPEQRRAYNHALDEALAHDSYTGEPLSKWMANTKMGKNSNTEESRGVFVDEVSCIGCKQCVWCAPATFRMEESHGRSRVFAQWLDEEDDIQAAIESCPVSCIHWVQRDDLPALEFVTQFKVPRVNVGVMMAGQGGSVIDVWDATGKFLKDREEKKKAQDRAAKYSKAQAEARAAAAEQLMRQQKGWWFNTIADKLGMKEAAAKIYASMDENLNGGASYSSASSSEEDEYAGYQRVGRRRRSRTRDSENYGARGDNGGRVPAERALVRVAVSRRPWEK